jgi:3-oxoacyl-[acyl-carrier protein] reductase
MVLKDGCVRLEDRVAVVTGAGTGMGRATAELLAREGAGVVVNYRRSKGGAEETVAGIRAAGGRAIAVAADVSNSEDAARLMDSAVREFGRIDYLVNNAGWTRRVPQADLEALTDEIWERTIDTNLRGVFYCARAAAPFLKQQRDAAIVNIASIGAVTGMGSSMAYAASKGGVVTLTKSLARVLAPAIRVNCVLPGLVRTGFVDFPAEFYDDTAKSTPLQRIAGVEDVAEAVLFLLARALSTTGDALFVDGGATTLAH